MSTERMMCSEAVLSVLNQGLGGGLPPELPPWQISRFYARKISASQSVSRKTFPPFWR